MYQFLLTMRNINVNVWHFETFTIGNCTRWSALTRLMQENECSYRVKNLLKLVNARSFGFSLWRIGFINDFLQSTPGQNQHILWKATLVSCSEALLKEVFIKTSIVILSLNSATNDRINSILVFCCEKQVTRWVNLTTRKNAVQVFRIETLRIQRINDVLWVLTTVTKW